MQKAGSSRSDAPESGLLWKVQFILHTLRLSVCQPFGVTGVGREDTTDSHVCLVLTHHALKLPPLSETETTEDNLNSSQ